MEDFEIDALTDEEVEEKLAELMKQIDADPRYTQQVFHADSVYFIVCETEIFEICDEAGDSPRGGWFPEIFTGRTKEEDDYIKAAMEKYEMDEDFFDGLDDDNGLELSNDEELLEMLEEEDEDALKIVKKIKKNIDGGKTPFSSLVDFRVKFHRHDCKAGRLYYEYEDEIYDFFDNINESGEPRGEYDSLDDREWLEVLSHIDNHVVRGGD